MPWVTPHLLHGCASEFCGDRLAWVFHETLFMEVFAPGRRYDASNRRTIRIGYASNRCASPGLSVVSQFEFLVPLHQGACGQTETLPAYRVH